MVVEDRPRDDKHRAKLGSLQFHPTHPETVCQNTLSHLLHLPNLSYVLAPRMPVHLGCCGTTDPLARAALRHEVVLARALSFTLIDHVRVLKLPTARATASHSLQTFGLAFLGSLFGWLSHDIVMPHEDIANVEDDF